MRLVSIANRHPRLQFDRRAVVGIIHALDANHATLATVGSSLGNAGELSIVFLTDQALAQLHARFLGDPTATDVITFGGEASLGTTGEICVSADAALQHVKNCKGGPTSGRGFRGVDVAAFSHELTLYIVHGWLHLAGYDDLAPAKKRVMRRAEARAIGLLERTEALPVFRIKTR